MGQRKVPCSFRLRVAPGFVIFQTEGVFPCVRGHEPNGVLREEDLARRHKILTLKSGFGFHPVEQ